MSAAHHCDRCPSTHAPHRLALAIINGDTSDDELHIMADLCSSCRAEMLGRLAQGTKPGPTDVPMFPLEIERRDLRMPA